MLIRTDRSTAVWPRARCMAGSGMRGCRFGLKRHFANTSATSSVCSSPALCDENHFEARFSVVSLASFFFFASDSPHFLPQIFHFRFDNVVICLLIICSLEFPPLSILMLCKSFVAQELDVIIFSSF